MQKILWVLFCATSLNSFAAVETGKPAPDFELTSIYGKSVSLASFKGKTVILEWFNQDCPYVRKFYDSGKMQELQKKQTQKGYIWLTINSSAKGKEGFIDAQSGAEVFKSKKLASTALLMDSDGKVGRMFGAKTTPHMYIVDEKGILVYQGAIDDRPSASVKSLDGAENYVVSALEAIANKQSVKNASTTPYGCSVKY